MPTSMYNGQQAPPNGCPGKPANPIKIHSSTFSALDVTGADDATTAAAAAAADVVIKCKHSAGHGDRTITKTQDSLAPSVRPSVEVHQFGRVKFAKSKTMRRRTVVSLWASPNVCVCGCVCMLLQY